MAFFAAGLASVQGLFPVPIAVDRIIAAGLAFGCFPQTASYDFVLRCARRAGMLVFVGYRLVCQAVVLASHAGPYYLGLLVCVPVGCGAAPVHHA